MDDEQALNIMIKAVTRERDEAIAKVASLTELASDIRLMAVNTTPPKTLTQAEWDAERLRRIAVVVRDELGEGVIDG